MGMAASQARLLMITARMHDIEYEAQTIQNAKLQLATQSDQVYQEYLKALDATTLTRTNMDGDPVTASFNNISGLGSIDFDSGLNNKYAITDNTHGGHLVVDKDVKKLYDSFFNEVGGDDPYGFALYAMGVETNELSTLEDSEEAIFEAHEGDKSANYETMVELRESMAELLAKYGISVDDGGDINDLVTLNGEEPSKDKEEAIDKYYELEDAYRYRLYNQFAAEIYAHNIGGNEKDVELFDNPEFKYYASVFKQIEEAGGCISVTEYDGPEGSATNDSDWLKTMIQSGKFSMHLVNEDKKTGIVSLNGTAVSSDSEIGLTTTSTIDKVALAKAEAEYEYATKKIDDKDKKYDMELSKLETERTALKTQQEAIKTIIKDNVERTFGIFS